METLKEQIQERIKQCMKDGNAFERDTLRTVLGEAQTKSLNSTNEDIVKILKKSKQACLDNIKYMQEPKISDANKEIQIYDQYIPKTLSVCYIVEKITKDPIIEQIKGAKSDGQATGIAINFFKKNELTVDGKDVTLAIKQMRN